MKILQISKNISIENIKKLSNNIKKISKKGFSNLNILNASKIKLNCNYKFCKEKQIKKGDSIKIFFYCNHLFHTKCLKIYNSKIDLFENNKANPSIVDIDKIEEFDNIKNSNIFLNSNHDNSEDICNCIICTEYEI